MGGYLVWFGLGFFLEAGEIVVSHIIKFIFPKNMFGHKVEYWLAKGKNYLDQLNLFNRKIMVDCPTGGRMISKK